jgi:anti-sigma regulatory factor (Ser/Thr protein kinase)
MSATDRSAPGFRPVLVVQPATNPDLDAGTGRSAAASDELTRLSEVALAADAYAPGAARIVISDCLTGLVAHRVLDEARLLGSELVGNSVRHGDLRAGDPVVVRVHLGAEVLRIEVENAGTAGTVTAQPAARGSGGFGLQLVELLAERWGVRRTHSTTVWFESGRS